MLGSCNFLIFTVFYIMCMSDLNPCLCVYHMSIWYPWRPKKGIGSLETENSKQFVSHYVGAGNQAPGCLLNQWMLLTTESSLQLLKKLPAWTIFRFMSLIYPDVVLEHSRIILVEATVPLIFLFFDRGRIFQE